MAIDEARLQAFMGNAVRDMGAVAHAATILIGDQLGLYKALARAPMTAAQLAAQTGTDARYVQEWLSAQAASGYVHYDPVSGNFSMDEEQALALATENSPVFLPGGFQIGYAMLLAVPKLVQAFRSGQGLGWHEHSLALFTGTERFFRPGYAANLVESWIPALDGVDEKLKAGAMVADVGCGHGASTVIMAQAYPHSRFIGFDYHVASVERARQAAMDAGVAERVSFEVASAQDFPGSGYDLVTVFDCLHDMGDPVGAARHVHQALDAEGSWMIVEPFANDRLEDNLNPVGRIFYSASTCICTPASRSQEVGLCLGAQAGEKRLREVVGAGGFSHFRRATETPFNLVFEARA
jgi:SAM-dependent methyltransferase